MYRWQVQLLLHLLECNMHADWTKGLTSEEDKARVRALVRSSAEVFQLLQEVLVKKAEQRTRLMRSQTNYASPAWPMQQADHLGVLRTLDDIRSLLTLTEENDI